MKYDYLIVGAGFAGSVAAERLASQGNKVLIIERRNHIGGNAYDFYDDNGILIHKYGPHIFHTNNKKVFDYLSQFTKWNFYEHKVHAKLFDKRYPLPINRTTINKLYNKNFNSEYEVKKFYSDQREKRYPIKNSEDIIINQVGIDLYEKFFKNYTMKQWNLDPKDLSPAVCGRIPIRTNDDDRYFTDQYQYMPQNGYTEMFNAMLNHRNIELKLNTDYKDIVNDLEFHRILFTGPIDSFFNYKFGKLPYRSVRFVFENFPKEFFQSVGVINFVEPKPEYTRITEYKYLTGQAASSTTISKEYSCQNGDPFYPILTKSNCKIYDLYKNEAKKNQKVLFLGRLAEYKYYNMDQIVAKTLKVVEREILV